MVVWGVLEVLLEITSLVLRIVEGGTFQTHHKHLGGVHIFATAAHYLDILVMHWSMVAKLVSNDIQNGDTTEGHQ